MFILKVISNNYHKQSTHDTYADAISNAMAEDNHGRHVIISEMSSGYVWWERAEYDHQARYKQSVVEYRAVTTNVNLAFESQCYHGLQLYAKTPDGEYYPIKLFKYSPNKYSQLNECTDRIDRRLAQAFYNRDFEV